MSEKAKELSILMPPPAIKGGLITRKKNPETENHHFKIPQPLGLYCLIYLVFLIFIDIF